jgi:hypothetical protein
VGSRRSVMLRPVCGCNIQNINQIGSKFDKGVKWVRLVRGSDAIFISILGNTMRT